MGSQLGSVSQSLCLSLLQLVLQTCPWPRLPAAQGLLRFRPWLFAPVCPCFLLLDAAVHNPPGYMSSAILNSCALNPSLPRPRGLPFARACMPVSDACVSSAATFPHSSCVHRVDVTYELYIHLKACAPNPACLSVLLPRVRRACAELGIVCTSTLAWSRLHHLGVSRFHPLLLHTLPLTEQESLPGTGLSL